MLDLVQILQDPKSRERLLLAFAGLLQGIATWVVIRVEPQGAWEQAMWLGGLAWILSSGLLFQFSSSGERHQRLVAPSLVLAIPFALVTYHVVGQLPPKDSLYAGDDYRLGTWCAAGTLALYILLPYLQIYQRNGRVQFRYADLYQHSWSNCFLAALGWFYAGIYWTLVWTCAALFKAIGITAIETIIMKPSFIAITTGIAGGLGVALAKEHTQVITTLRTIASTLFRSLIPLLVIIVLGFLVTLPFTGLSPLLNTKWASAILLALLLLIMLFVNAVFQDGEGTQPSSTVVRRGIEATLVSMLILVGLTSYSMGLRIAQYGFTPERYYAIVFAIILGGYSAGYAWSVVRRDSVWLRGLRHFNIAFSFVVIGLAFLLHTPLMDPLKRSAEDQERRFLSGAVDVAHFDFGTMRFELGQYGQAVLERMSRLTAHPAYPQLVDQLAQLETAKHKWEWNRNAPVSTPEELLSKLTVFPSDHTVPSDLLAEMSRGKHHVLIQKCSQEHPCTLVARQWDSDQDTEYVFINGCGHASTECATYTVVLYDHQGRSWRQAASITFTDPHSETATPSQADTVRAAREGHLTFSGTQYHCFAVARAGKICDYAWDEKSLRSIR